MKARIALQMKGEGHAIGGEVNQEFVVLVVVDHGADRHDDRDILGIAAGHLIAGITAVRSFDVLAQSHVKEGTAPTLSEQNDVAATPPIGAVGAAARNVLFAVHAGAAVAPVPAGYGNDGFIKKQ